jgi:hypothetical protein
LCFCHMNSLWSPFLDIGVAGEPDDENIRRSF